MRRIVAILAATFVLAVTPAAMGGAADGPVGAADFPPPVDPESWVLPEWMTWDDYWPIPGVDWHDPARQPPRRIRAALILGDFEDRQFIVSQPPGSDLFGLDSVHNPMLKAPVPAEELADWWARFLVTEPSELNHFHTINEYWLEDSYGLIGVDAEGFGPYRLDGKEHEYGLGGGDAGGGGERCPAGDTCDGGFDEELLQKSLIDVTTGMVTNGEDYDFRYLLHAGYDESGVWQEFGEMMFPTPDDVTEPFGNPDDAQPNWVDTRYIDWTSFAAGKALWSHALPGLLSVQGESDGQSTYAHELSHIFGLLDNYNNPFSDPPVRSYTGTWAMLSRGTFNGPGGTHNRWQIPPTLGGSMGSHHMLRNKIRLGFVKPTEVLFLERETLALTGPQFATIHPRAYPLAPVTTDVGRHGVHVAMGEDRSVCEDPAAFDCDGGGYTSYTLEFVDRIGYDSFTTDSGVLIAKNKDVVDLAPFMWAIDAHPEDINELTPPPPNAHREIHDFIRPNGEVAPVSIGDARQLADALFHAGTGDRVVHEYVDEANRLHFYVLDTDTDDRGVSTYRVAVRSLDGGGPWPRGLLAGDVADGAAHPGRVATVLVAVSNTGAGASDLVRLAATVPDRWEARLRHEVIEMAPGETIEVPVLVRVAPGATADGEVSLTATSETDPSATVTASGTVAVATAQAGSPGGGRVPLPATGGGLALAGALLGLVGAGLGRRRMRGGRAVR